MVTMLIYVLAVFLPIAKCVPVELVGSCAISVDIDIEAITVGFVDGDIRSIGQFAH